MNETGVLIQLDNIRRAYKMGAADLEILKGLSLTIRQGEFVAIMGPSGSGKSTLMQILGLLDKPTSGTYTLMGRDVAGLSEDECAILRSKTIGFIFQMFNLLPRTTSLDNVVLPMLYSGLPNRLERGKELLREVGMENRMLHKPNQLSGGQQQRVAVARALVNRPQIIFADEPTGNLATAQSEEILARLQALNRSGITIIMVTHEPDIAAHARRILHIKDGRILSDVDNAAVAQNIPAGPAAPGALPMASPAPTAASPTPPPHAPESKSSMFPNVRPPKISVSEFSEYIASALRAMSANRVRSALSVLGILIGVSSVIAMLAIGNGAQKAIEARLQSLGSNVVMLFGGAPSSRGVRGAAGNYSRLTLEDAKAVRMASPDIVELYPEAEGDVEIVYQDKNKVSEMQGVTPNYASIRNAHPDYGRFFTEAENENEARVIVICPNVVKKLFGDENPVGKTLKINRVDFRVIGTLPSKGAGSGDQDDMVFTPIHTAMKRVLGTVYLHEMAIECANPQSIPAVMAAIETLMRHRHRLPPYKENDFRLRNNAEVQSTLSGTTKTFSSLLGFVAAISLLVGGVGIMNIMLVSVNERTREIGLRKSIGATRRAILLQFLIESVLLSVLGGLLGISLGIGVANLVSRFAGWLVLITYPSIALSFAFSVSVGVVFGYWPARKASRLSPMEALRYE